MSYEFLTVDREGQIATVTLNRPEKRNALSRALRAEIGGAFGELSVDDRHLYHEALEAVFPPGITVSVTEPPKLRRKKVLLIVVGASVLAGAVYLWLHGLFG